MCLITTFPKILKAMSTVLGERDADVRVQLLRLLLCEQEQLRVIEQLTQRKILRHPIPTLTDALAGQQRITVERVLKATNEPVSSTYKAIAENLLEDHDSVTLLATALKLLTKEPSTLPVKLTEEHSKPKTTPG